jgi:hypothetical protein
LGFHPNVDALLVWDPVHDRTVFALSVRILAGRTFANFSESLPGTGILSTDAAPSLTLPPDIHVPSSPSPPLDSPPIFDCNIPACSACALNDAYLAVSRVQPRMDTQLYASHDTCAVCAADGTLVCCEFCDVVFHATCIPALRPHLPPAGLTCAECFADSFPDQRATYDRLFYQRPLALPVSTSHDSLPVQSSIPPVSTTSDAVLPISASLQSILCLFHLSRPLLMCLRPFHGVSLLTRCLHARFPCQPHVTFERLVAANLGTGTHVLVHLRPWF